MDTMKQHNETIYLLDTEGSHTEGAYCLINLSHNPSQFVLRRYRDLDKNAPCSRSPCFSVWGMEVPPRDLAGDVREMRQRRTAEE